MKKQVLISLYSALKSYRPSKGGYIQRYLDDLLLPATCDSQDVSRSSYQDVDVRIESLVQFDFPDLCSALQRYIILYTGIIYQTEANGIELSAYVRWLYQKHLAKATEETYIEVARRMPDVIEHDLTKRGFNLPIAAYFIRRPNYRYRFNKQLKQMGKNLSDKGGGWDTTLDQALECFVSHYLEKLYSEMMALLRDWSGVRFHARSFSVETAVSMKEFDNLVVDVVHIQAKHILVGDHPKSELLAAIQTEFQHRLKGKGKQPAE